MGSSSQGNGGLLLFLVVWAAIANNTHYNSGEAFVVAIPVSVVIGLGGRLLISRIAAGDRFAKILAALVGSFMVWLFFSPLPLLFKLAEEGCYGLSYFAVGAALHWWRLRHSGLPSGNLIFAAVMIYAASAWLMACDVDTVSGAFKDYVFMVICVLIIPTVLGWITVTPMEPKLGDAHFGDNEAFNQRGITRDR